MNRLIHTVGAFVWIGVLLVFLTLLALNTGYLFWGMGDVIPGIVGQQCSACSVDIFVIFPFPIFLFSFSDPGWFIAYYVALILALTISIILAVFYDGKKLVSDMVSSIRDARLRLSTKTSWAMIAQLFCAYLFFNTVYVLILTLAGVDTGTPDTTGIPLWYTLYGLANASVYEEIITRLIFLGIPMFVIALANGVRGRSLARELFGGSRRNSGYVWVLIIISGTIFGLAHVPGWDFWKLTPTLLAGVMLGYVYVQRGIWAAILFHFFVDYFAVSLLVSDQTSNLGLFLLLGIATIIFLVAGLLFFLYYSMKVYEAVAVAIGRPRPKPVVAAPQNQPPAQAQPAFGFVCSRCGHSEARYVDGQFVCLRCGQVQ